VAESRFPGWEAAIDGAFRPLDESGGRYLSVPVPAGRHRVELAFTSTHLAAGGALSAAGIALVAALLLAPLRPVVSRLARGPRGR
jgi:uncharacterized membrane protein YfhO